MDDDIHIETLTPFTTYMVEIRTDKRLTFQEVLDLFSGSGIVIDSHKGVTYIEEWSLIFKALASPRTQAKAQELASRVRLPVLFFSNPAIEPAKILKRNKRIP